ncbi:MAG: hypothetical protein OXU19_16740 [bacterium]|nr:hypothetical protein [bacterium]
MTSPQHQDVLNMLKRRYDGPIMNNVSRGHYVECMIAITLGTDWQLTWASGWDWAAWDLEHLCSGIRLEIKQAAARQTWDNGQTPARSNPVFDIAPRRGYWTREGLWVDAPGRQADAYIFAWHGRDDNDADQTDPRQWLFFVVAERDLSQGQKSIGLRRLQEITDPCDVVKLRGALKLMTVSN